MVKTYRRVWRESGHPAGAERVQMSFHAYVAETHEKAVAGYTPAMQTYLDVFSNAVSSWAGLQSGGYPGYDKLTQAGRAACNSVFNWHERSRLNLNCF